MKKVPRFYCLMLKFGEMDDRVIRGISVRGGEALMKKLKNNPPAFVTVKGHLVSTSSIVKLAPVY